eukprot:gene10306-2723_t
MKFFLVVVVLLGLIYTSHAGPVACVSSANVLEIGDALEVDNYCPVESTCEYQCSCGKAVYFDLTTMKYWTHINVQKAWKKVCQAVSLEKWVEEKTAQGIASLPKKKSGSWLRRRRRVDHQAASFLKFLVSVFQIVETKYRNICKGGEKISNKEAESLRQYFVGRMNNYAAKTSGMSIAKKIAGFMFDEFIGRHHSKQFEFCSCYSFRNALPYASMRSRMYRDAVASCHNACKYKKVTKTTKRSFTFPTPIRRSRRRRSFGRRRSAVTLEILEEED